jgi:hypothetical protein
MIQTSVKISMRVRNLSLLNEIRIGSGFNVGYWRDFSKSNMLFNYTENNWYSFLLEQR